MRPSNFTELAELPQSDYVTSPLCFPEIFTPEECDAILAMDGDRATYRSGLLHPVEGYRSALTSYIPPCAARSFIDERLDSLVRSVNRHYRFELTAFEEHLLISRYHVEDHFDWHIDSVDKENSLRKLSISVQLSEPSDYDGGALEFMPHGEVVFSRDRGTAILFPAYLCHRVTRVTRGVRASMVTHALGPTFR